MDPSSRRQRTRVRPMARADIAEVQRVELAAAEIFRSHPDPRIAACADHDPMPADALAELIDEERAWIAVDGSDVAGFLVVRVLDGNAHVEEVAVRPEHGRRGHASVLLEEVAAWAVDQGFPAVTLTTFRDVAWNRPFYERRGFRVLGDDELSTAQQALLVEEDERYGLARELRVLMRRDVHTVPSRVRDATLDDLPAITALFNALIPTTTIAWRDHPADHEEMRDWYDGQQGLGFPVLVAERDGEVVGYTTWAWFRGGPRFPGYGHSMELTVHVRGDHHRRGVGRALIETLVDRARTAGVHVLVAGVDADNASSYEFHRRLGFTEVARMPEVGRKFDRWLDLVLLQRVIE